MTTVKAAELAYVRVQVPDLDAAETFYTTFGLLTHLRTPDTLYMRGYGPEQYLVAAHRGERRIMASAFEVGSEEALLKASQMEGASAIEDIEGPGGGRKVSLLDPDGNKLELVYGIARNDPIPVPTLPLNSAHDRTSRRNEIVRPAHGPSRVLRIGHVVLRSPDIEPLKTWYQQTLGLLESDEVAVPDGDGLLMSFVRLDHADDYVDHHVMLFLKGGKNEVHHISFEVQGIDDLHTGHEALKNKGYRSIWGIGRHVQGSQVFDYWLDPFGTMYEHWTDTDMLNATVPKTVMRLEDMHAPWGPSIPPEFLAQGTR